MALRNSNINVTVVHLWSDKPQIQKETNDGIQHWYFPEPMRKQRMLDSPKYDEFYYRNITYLFRLHIKDKKDLIFHLNYEQNNKLAKELKDSFECKIIVTVHFSEWGLTIFDNLKRLRKILCEVNPESFSANLKKSFENEKSLYLKADHIICLSQYMHKVLCIDYGLTPARVSFVPNGLTNTVNTKNNNQYLRNKWKILYEEKFILFVGRIEEIKGLTYLIRAFREVLQKFPICRLIIVGNGYYDIHMKVAKEICTKITFTGLLEKKELYELYQIADVGVVPSLFEPFGYVAVEMMMHELPIVATATSGLNEVVDDCCGLKIPIIEHSDRIEIDSNLLAEKIIYLLEHPDKARKMGQNGRKRYLSEYSSEVFRRNMLNFYTSLYET